MKVVRQSNIASMKPQVGIIVENLDFNALEIVRGPQLLVFTCWMMFSKLTSYLQLCSAWPLEPGLNL